MKEKNGLSESILGKKTSHDLYRLSDGRFMVKSFKLQKPYVLPTVEGAAEALTLVGVPEDEIDYALIDMAQKGNNHAHFGILYGAFIFSDKVDEVVAADSNSL